MKSVPQDRLNSTTLTSTPLQLYKGKESEYRLNQLYEFVGVLSTSQPATDQLQEQEELFPENPKKVTATGGMQIPRIHAICTSYDRIRQCVFRSCLG